MSLLEIAAVLLTLVAIFAFLNARWVKLPSTIGLMVLALVFSLLLLGIAQIYPPVVDAARRLLRHINFNRAVLDGALGYILFAGALHVDLEDLRRDKLVIGILATLGVVISTALVGVATWAMTQMLGLDTPILFCLLFGVVISPTDPIAVLSILKRMGVPRALKTDMAGESLFNDGVSIVLFLALLGMTGIGGPTMANPSPAHRASASPPTSTPTSTSANQPAAKAPSQNESSSSSIQPPSLQRSQAHGTSHPTPTGRQIGQIGLLFLQEAGGGVAFGLALGLIGYLLLKSLDHYQTEVLITLALTTGGYALAIRLGLSGPLAIVTAGLIVGSAGRATASKISERNMDMFWELIDEIITATLFVLVGMGILDIRFTTSDLIVGLLAIPLVIVVRFVAIGGPIMLMRLRRTFVPHTIKVMTWGGLRGAVSVALALALRQYVYHHTPNTTARDATDLLLVMTYLVVLFSVIVQGLTMQPLLSYLSLSQREAERDVSEPE